MAECAERYVDGEASSAFFRLERTEAHQPWSNKAVAHIAVVIYARISMLLVQIATPNWKSGAVRIGAQAGALFDIRSVVFPKPGLPVEVR